MGRRAPLASQLENSLMNDHILHNHHHDGVDRRGFLKCMAWAGTGVVWSLSGGVLTSRALGQTAAPGAPRGPPPPATPHIVH
jgi:hypothetical protein